MAAKYFPQYCSYKTPKRLPKKRNRPTTSAFRAAAAHLDFINSLSGDFNIPDIVNLLSESEDDLIEINNLSEGLERLQDTKKTSTFLSERDNIAKNEEGSEAFAGKNSKGELWRRIVWDYDDEAEGNPTASATTPQPTQIRLSKRNRSPDNPCLSRAASYFSTTIDANERPAKKARTRSRKLAAKIEESEINMEGWELPELLEKKWAKQSLRSATRSKKTASSGLVDIFEEDELSGSGSPCQIGESAIPPPLGRKVLRRMQDVDTASVSRTSVRKFATRRAAHGNATYPSSDDFFASRNDEAQDNGYRHGEDVDPRADSLRRQKSREELTGERAEGKLQKRVEERMLDVEDMIHAGCDVPLNSIEDVDASS